MNHKPQLLSLSQAADLLGCDRRQLRKMRDANPAIAVKLPGFTKWRYVRSKLVQAAGISEQQQD